MKQFFSWARMVFFAGFCVKWIFEILDVGYWSWTFVFFVQNREDYSWGPLMLWASWEFCRRSWDLLFQFFLKKWREMPENIRRIIEDMEKFLSEAKEDFRTSKATDKVVKTKEVSSGVIFSVEIYHSPDPYVRVFQYHTSIFFREEQKETVLKILQAVRRNKITLSSGGKIAVTMIANDLLLFFLQESDHPLYSDLEP